MIRDLLKAFALSNALPIAGIVLALCVTGWGAYRISVAHARSAGFSRGYAVARDSALEATILRMKAQHDSAAHVSDSLAQHAHRGDSLLALRPGIEHAPPRFQRIDSTGLVPTVPLSSLVAVYTASDSLPHYADRYVANLVIWYDSIVYKQLLPQRDSAIVLGMAWKRAYIAEHQAREGADSLAALWRERALNVVAPPKQSHVKRNAVYAALGAAVALIARNQFHHR